ncbi:hypothetical protein AYK24_10640 [Thermoplasmatales archaeon SG8-52-4]|nr:MAG: hypothetical protein AYK24_10640 [Thermoplasmatales archaeon SG8-52-4]
MHKIKILNENRVDLFTKNIKNETCKSKKIVKINDDLLELGLRKGLIEKDRDGFYFLGSYEKFLDFKNKKNYKIN